MAHLVELGIEAELPEEMLSVWRNAATLRNLGFDDTSNNVTSLELVKMLQKVRQRVVEAGDLSSDAIAEWSVLGGCSVSQGFLRGGTLPVQSILDVVDGMLQMVTGALPPDPPNQHWYLGPRSGRSTAPAYG